MKRRPRTGFLQSMLLALAAAEAGGRLLAPREPPIEPDPVALEAYFSAAQVRRGAAYARPQAALALARAAVDLGALALLVRRPPAPLRRPSKRPSKRPVAAGAAVGATLATTLTLPSLPLAAVARRRARKVGLVTQSWRGWGVDLIKATGIQAAFAAAAGGAVIATTRRYPRGWWLPAAAGSVLVGAALSGLAPVLLDPLFNDFTPLPDGQLRTDLLELAQAAGVEVGELYSVDASRRGTAANAYVTGLGPTKRVVLFDTLLDRYSADEVRVVVAHELAHVRNRDVPRGIAYAAIVAPAAARAAQRLSWALASADAEDRGTPAGLPALALSAALVTAPIGLVANRLSRAIERRADDYSLALSGAPDAFISFERAVALQNVADLDPPRWLTRLLATHPPARERIGAAVAWSRRHVKTATPPRPGSSAT
ncbi:MAG: M48 family metalloprotease [Solirubrobacteraceae bacterium]